MKILVVAPGVPNQFHRIRLNHIIHALGENNKISGCYLNIGHPIAKQKMAGAHIEQKSPIQSIIDSLFFLLLPQPLEVSYCHSPSLKNKVGLLSRSHDIILVKRLRALQYIPRDTNKPVLIDSTDAMSLFYQKAKDSVSWWQKPLYFEEWIKYLIYEKWASKKYKNWVVCSEDDASYLKRVLSPGTHVWVVPNVVDTSYYKEKSPSREKTILFSGLMEKHVNQSAAYFFLEKIYPKIKKVVPAVKLYIVGPNPPSKLISYQKDKSITVTGKVEDIRTYIDFASVVVTPTLIGTGMRNKILQALSHNRPVVTTTLGAQGLSPEIKKILFIADSPKSFAQNTISLLTNEGLRKKMAKKGRALIKKHYSLPIMRQKYNEVLHSVVLNEQDHKK